MNQLILNNIISVIIAVLFTCFMFWVGMWYEKKTKQIKQRDCKHDFRMIRICKLCDLRQREVKQ